ncbi:MAG: hypothetical protein FWC38_07885 [Proteobacteria bacterium]|nr:hypothetical protein [Pseudomonadota bacterium]MCL2308121.1 hypothetical protein [Pseudomonadota bacterium]
MIRRSGFLFAGLLALLSTNLPALSLDASSPILRVEGMPVISTKAEPVVVWRSALKADAATAVVFAPLPETALKALQEENSRSSSGDVEVQTMALKIGVNRDAATEVRAPRRFSLNWQPHGDGHVAQLVVTSPDAHAMRVALQLDALPDDAEMRFSGSGEPERILGVISGKEANGLRDDRNVYWTPVTEGDTQNIEIYLPSSVKTEDIRIHLDGVSHLFTSAREQFSTANLVKSTDCHVNVACRYGSGTNGLGTHFENASKAVARMTYTSGSSSYTCTGTLLNDSIGSGTPYFWSAAHCVRTSAAANTVNTHWFQESTTCGGTTLSANYRQLTGGATLLHANTAADTVLLQLKNNPPAGAFFSGWDATQLTNNASAHRPAYGIHHPGNALKRVNTSTSPPTRTCGNTISNGMNPALLSRVDWNVPGGGIVLNGSSGSGIFTVSPAGGYLLRGGLMGTVRFIYPGSPHLDDPENHSCTQNNHGCYSGLFHVWEDVKQWLSPETFRAFSRKVHGTGANAVTFDLPIRADGSAITVEPRSGGPNRAFEVVFRFNAGVNSASATLAGAGTVASTTISNNEVTVRLTNVPDRTRLGITLTVNGTANAASANIGFLLGDVDGSRQVDVNDVLAVLTQSGQMANATNYLRDVDADGQIDVGDVITALTRAGGVLP